MRCNFLGKIIVAIVVFAVPANARPAGDFAGHWIGLWHGGTTHDTYKPDILLRDDGNGQLSGEIHWTLVTAGQPQQQGKEGITGTEYVAGHTDGGELILDGVRLDDPNHILGMDAYRLVLSDNGNMIGGITSDGGTWSGSLRAERVH